LRVDYLRPGRPELMVAEGLIVRVGRSVGVSDMRVFHPSAEDVTIATGKGVYSIKMPKHPSR
jgi:acyl-coenzyme A thioesterase PaaI-like protein